MRFAIGELGLKPWEFKDMSIKEYALYSQGYFIRNARFQDPFRKLFHILWNANTKKSDQIKSIDSLSRVWPLATDKTEGNVVTAESMKEMWATTVKKWKERKALEKTHIKN